MDKQSKIEFVRDLSKNIADSICRQIEYGQVPEDWDGIELRMLLALRHKDSASMGSVSIGRKRKFTNTVIVNNL